MSLYSTSPRIPPLGGPRSTKFEPFVAYARVTPDREDGRRFVYYRGLENAAQKVEEDLIDAGFHIATPIAFTPQFQQAPARLTIVGFVETTENSGTTEENNNPPVTPTAKIIHSGTVDGEKTSVQTPIQGNQGWGDNPTAANQTNVMNLKADLEAASSGIEIFYINYNGVRYGTLPNKKGFFSFP